jgi:hypothetical protein
MTCIVIRFDTVRRAVSEERPERLNKSMSFNDYHQHLECIFHQGHDLKIQCPDSFNRCHSQYLLRGLVTGGRRGIGE